MKAVGIHERDGICSLAKNSAWPVRQSREAEHVCAELHLLLLGQDRIKQMLRKCIAHNVFSMKVV